VDLTEASAFATRAGENWMQALDRLMTQSGLYADVDFDTRHIRLHRDPPKSGALNYVTGEKSQPDAIAQIAAKADVPAPQASLLADYFGAQAIRDGDDAHTQIRFSSKPAAELSFKTPDGRPLHSKWDASTNVMTLDRAERIVVSDGSKSVEIGRSAGTVYDFDKTSPAHLETVFDRDGHTYFKFAESVVQVTVADVKHLGSGEQKGRYYMFNGTSEQFIVTGDGNTVNVTRRHDVKYFERPTPEAPVAPTPTAVAKS
jgi:hypothetical protein